MPDICQAGAESPDTSPVEGGGGGVPAKDGGGQTGGGGRGEAWRGRGRQQHPAKRAGGAGSVGPYALSREQYIESMLQLAHSVGLALRCAFPV